MQVGKLLFATLLFSILLLPCKGKDSLYFAVAGQCYSKRQCSIKKSDLIEESVLRLFLSGTFSSQPVDVHLSVKNSYGTSILQDVKLSLDGISITANREAMRISKENVNRLRSGRQHIVLTLPQTLPADATILLIANQANSTNELGRLAIRIEGLRTPGSEVYDENDNFYLEILPSRVRVYETPSNRGSLTIDLRNIPQGQSGTVELIDLLGITSHTQHVIGGTTVQIPASTVQQGLYFVRVSIEGTPVYTGRAFAGK